jgi:hypothetical protein
MTQDGLLTVTFIRLRRRSTGLQADIERMFLYWNRKICSRSEQLSEVLARTHTTSVHDQKTHSIGEPLGEHAVSRDVRRLRRSLFEMGAPANTTKVLRVRKLTALKRENCSGTAQPTKSRPTIPSIWREAPPADGPFNQATSSTPMLFPTRRTVRSEDRIFGRLPDRS